MKFFFSHKTFVIGLSALITLAFPTKITGAEPLPTSNKHVILISIDGLRPDALSALGPRQTPNFHRLILGGASTMNARTDPDFTTTLPNHFSIITGRPVRGAAGHQYETNEAASKNIHDIKGEFVKSVFDVAHEAGFSTAMLASKNKFAVFAVAYAGHAPQKKNPPKILGSKSLDIVQLSDRNDEALVDYF